MSSYKFRAECLADVTAVINSWFLDRDGKWQRITIEPLLFPDVVVTLEATSSIEQIRNIMERVEDSHVMRETLSEVETYTGERKHDEPKKIQELTGAHRAFIDYLQPKSPMLASVLKEHWEKGTSYYIDTRVDLKGKRRMFNRLNNMMER